MPSWGQIRLTNPVVGQRVEPDLAVLACRVVESDGWCRRCGAEGAVRDSVVRRLAHEPFGWRPTTLAVTLRRYRCSNCGHVWRQDTAAVAQPRSKISRGGLRWALVAIVCQHLTVARVAEALGVSWNCANTAVLDEGRRVLIADPGRFDGVRVLGVDEHVWRHTRRGDKYVTVIIDLTPIRGRHGPSAAVGHGRRPHETRLQDVARGAAKGVARRHRGRRHGRILGLQNRDHRGAPRSGRGDGPFPRRPVGRRRARRLPPTRPTGHAQTLCG